jgi:predicted CXXCH cytochrome family protein
MKRVFTGICLLTAFFFPQASFAAKLQILSPPGKIYLSAPRISIVVLAEKNAFDLVKIFVNGSEVKTFTDLKDTINLCYVASVGPGLNRIRVSGYKAERPIEDREVLIFGKSVLSSVVSAPPGYQKFIFHTGRNDGQCMPCHKMDSVKEDEGPSAPEKSTCYPCHKDVTKAKYIHGPASVWACPTCHNVNTEEQKNGVPWPEEAVCYPCHGDVISKWKDCKFTHGPTAVGHCSACHNAHGSDYPLSLRLHATDLCLSCHQDKASGSHVVAGFASRGHPVRNRPDPRDIRRELTCASCHNPHAANTPDLLPYKKDDPEFCLQCHKF